MVVLRILLICLRRLYASDWENGLISDLKCSACPFVLKFGTLQDLCEISIISKDFFLKLTSKVMISKYHSSKIAKV